MSAPGISRVLETVLYFTSESETKAFYSEVLGLRLIGEEAGRHMFFRMGDGVLLLFNPSATAEAGSVPAHGATGQGHACFLASGGNYEQWKQHLEGRGVSIIQEASWPPGAARERIRGVSFYFRDPSGNLLEIANTDFWPP
ncbi:MAG: VOC family protein [Actinomycetota bacterium]